MAVDEALLIRSLSADRKDFLPTLRFYFWKRPTLSLGYSQDYTQAVNPAYCREEGIDVVRRITGGLAVLHDDELTYAVVPGAGEFSGVTSILETYKKISLAILRGLHYYGVQADLVQKQRPADRAAMTRKKRTPCFAVQTKYEIAAQGRKLIGSAQRRIGKCFLQHGSIPFTLHEERLYRAANNEGDRSGAGFTSLSEITGRAVDRDRLIHCLLLGFREVLAIDLKEGGLSKNEQEISGILEKKQYNLDSWNRYRRKEAFPLP